MVYFSDSNNKDIVINNVSCRIKNSVANINNEHLNIYSKF